MQVGEWFCLTDRFNFSIDPVTDKALYFGRQQLQQHISGVVKRSFGLGYPLKAVLYGEFGVGKTHTLRHLEYYLQKNQADFPSEPYYLECGDIERKTRYVALHQNIMDRIGLEKVKELLSKFQSSRGPTWRDEIKSFVGSTDLANAFASLLSYGQVSNMAWVWLQGSGLSQSDRASLGVTLDLTETADLITALKLIGKLFRDTEKKSLVLLIDEMERLGDVDEADAVNNWTHAMRMLADKSNDTVGVVLAAAFRKKDDMPMMFVNAQVTRRFNEGAGFIEISSFQQKPDVEAFLKDLLGVLIDKTKLATLASRERLNTVSNYNEATFPFTSDALSKFVDYVVQTTDSPTPSIVLAKLDSIAFDAMEAGKRVIDVDFLQKQGMA